jgi:hypothetical protein
LVELGWSELGFQLFYYMHCVRRPLRDGSSELYTGKVDIAHTSQVLINLRTMG